MLLNSYFVKLFLFLFIKLDCYIEKISIRYKVWCACSFKLSFSVSFVFVNILMAVFEASYQNRRRLMEKDFYDLFNVDKLLDDDFTFTENESDLGIVYRNTRMIV